MQEDLLGRVIFDDLVCELKYLKKVKVKVLHKVLALSFLMLIKGGSLYGHAQ